MNISMLELDPRHIAAANAISDPGYMHRKIQEAFNAERSRHKVLYRLLDYAERKILYVQSMIAPNWSAIDNKGGFRLIEVKNIGGLEETFQEGNLYRFVTKLYPSRKKEDKRYPLTDPKSRLEWLSKEAEKNGFEIVETQESRQNACTIWRKTGAFKMGGVVYEGILKVKNREAFIKGYQDGIGPEKAYGFGLLMLKGRV